MDNIKIKIIEPIGYIEMLRLLKHAKVIITDSGGLQEEACILRIPCVTVRKNTERPETVGVGANILAGTESKKIVSAVQTMLYKRKRWKNPFGSSVSKKIVDKILKYDDKR